MRKGDIEKMVAGPLKIIQMLPGMEEGGVEQGTLEMNRYLSGVGHKSIIISQGGRMVPKLEKDGGIHLEWRYIGEKNPRCLRYIWPLRNLLIEKNIDILHLRSRLPAWVGYIAWKSLPLKKRPALITTFHGFYSINAYSAVMTRGQKIIAVSKTIAKHIVDEYGIEKKRIIVINRGFDEKKFDPDAVSAKKINNLRAKWKLNSSDSPVILMPARITRLKGHDIFFKSLSMAAELPWTAICAGDMDERSSHSAYLKKLIFDLKLKNRVRIVGHCDDMAAAIKLSDVIVSASIKPESFGRIAVEAQAMGKPVIATAHGGTMETVIDQKTGILVKPADVKEMAGAIKQMLGDVDLRKRLGDNGKKWVKNNFTVKKMCEDTLKLYYRELDSKLDETRTIY